MTNSDPRERKAARALVYTASGSFSLGALRRGKGTAAQERYDYEGQNARRPARKAPEAARETAELAIKAKVIYNILLWREQK